MSVWTGPVLERELVRLLKYFSKVVVMHLSISMLCYRLLMLYYILDADT